MKTCHDCKQSLPLDQFYVSKAKPQGDYKCKECRKAYTKSRRTPENSKRIELRARYGITLEQYYELLELQGGVCKICKEICASGRLLAVDHNHQTGEVRSLLCGNCNRGLGYFKDNPALLTEAATYLKSYE